MMTIIESLNTFVGVSLTVLLFIASCIAVLASFIRHRVYKSRSRTSGTVQSKRGKRMTVEWEFQGQTHTNSMGHSLLFLAHRKRRVPLRVYGFPPQVSFDYWFTNGIGTGILGICGLVLSIGGFLLLIFM